MHTLRRNRGQHSMVRRYGRAPRGERCRVAHELATGALVEVMADTPPEPSPVYVLYPAGRHSSSRTRAFVDWASALLVPKFNRD